MSKSFPDKFLYCHIQPCGYYFPRITLTLFFYSLVSTGLYIDKKLGSRDFEAISCIVPQNVGNPQYDKTHPRRNHFYLDFLKEFRFN